MTRKTLLILFTLITMAVSGLALAHSGATCLLKQRMDAMKDMSKQARLVTKMFKGQTEFDKAELVIAADLFVVHGEEMLSLFPDTEQSRNGKKTEALPKIWKDWEGFSDSVDEFVALSNSLREDTETTDDMKVLRKSFRQAMESCSGCHKAYRKPKQR